MAEQVSEASVLFADVSGSTKLYETAGDAIAHAAIEKCVNLMREKTVAAKGRVIKTIGDEVMSAFPTADNAADAAIEMQSAIIELPPVGNTQMGIRIGFNHGPIVERDGDVFGDAVNLAARLADKENQSDAAAGVVTEDVAEVHDILQDLTRRETRAYSHMFSRTLVSLWKGAAQLNKNPQRSAGFRVLKALDVPSVLVELGYLSNEKDLANLVSPEWREKAAGTLASAIDSFFTQRSIDAATVSPDAVAKVALPADPAPAPR